MAHCHDEDRPQQPHASVTGSPSGIGFAITRGLVEAGAAVKPDKARAAAVIDVRRAFAGDASKLRHLDDLLKGLGLEARRPGTAR
jgi:NAD(P)-dependent dehydrogenase (short-subunit alcohol dehydrogenase family)